MSPYKRVFKLTSVTERKLGPQALSHAEDVTANTASAFSANRHSP